MRGVYTTPVVTKVVDLEGWRDSSIAYFPHHPMKHQGLPVNSSPHVVSEIAVWVYLVTSDNPTVSGELDEAEGSRRVS